MKARGTSVLVPSGTWTRSTNTDLATGPPQIRCSALKVGYIGMEPVTLGAEILNDLTGARM